MKVLILTMTTGSGHNKCSEAIYNCFKEKNIECKIIDCLDYISPTLKMSFDKTYHISTRHFSHIYGEFYNLSDREANANKGLISKISSLIFMRKLVKYIVTERFEIVICTHAFSAIFIDYMIDKIVRKVKKNDVTLNEMENPNVLEQFFHRKEKRSLLMKVFSKIITVGVVTDFAIHPNWEKTKLDYYIVADEVIIKQGKRKGIPEYKIKPFGIPIDSKFSQKFDKYETRETLGLDDTLTVLVVSGGAGYGNLIDLLLELDESEINFQVIVVCGNNEKLRKKLEKQTYTRKIKILGFVENLDLWMDASDVAITKAGGMSSAECLAKNLPFILFSAIPGQEDRNVSFLLNYGVALRTDDSFKIEDAIHFLFSNNDKMQCIKENMKNVAKPHATESLCNFLINLK